MMKLRLIRPLMFLGCLLPVGALAGITDNLVLGNPGSESAHQMTADFSEVRVGGLGEISRRLLPGGALPWQGGILKFSLKVDPEVLNYLTLRLWGDEVNDNQMTLHVDGRQIGYRHLGDIEALETGSDAPGCPGRFLYRTTPLPIELTKGRSEISCEIRATGPISAYSSKFEQYQKPMTEPARGIYRIYSHTDGCFVPPRDEKQGISPEKKEARPTPGPEVMEALKNRVNRQIDSLLSEPARPANQMQALFLAKAYFEPWTHAFGKPETVTKILASLDSLYRGFVKDPKLAQAEPSTYNPEWFGLGPSGWVISLLETPLKARFDEPIDDGNGHQIARREAFRDMLLACRDWHRENRRQYTNQSMINDLYGIYVANRGLAVLAPDKALPEKQALRYLHESIGLEPWLGSEKDGTPTRPLGDHYLQLTAKGLTRELGFVGNYGEVIDWVCQIYDGTRPAPGQPGDPAIKAQLVRIARARAPFRYPMPDAYGYPAMRQETVVGWRDTHFPGDVTYTQRPTFDGSPLEVADLTLDPHLLGGVAQMFKDNQFYDTIGKHMEDKGFRITFGLLAIPGQLERIEALAPAPVPLPMSRDQPDFVFTDEDDGVVAVKYGREILYVSLYWRARFAVNFLGRVHLVTPEFDRIATVAEDIRFTPSGMDYTRPNWTNFGFGNGGPRYPDSYQSAHTGQKLPIAKIPDGIAFKPGQENIHAGRGDFYQLRYGSYLIAMNMSADKSFEFKAPESPVSMINLVTGKPVAAGSVSTVAPHSTLVIRLKETGR